MNCIRYLFLWFPCYLAAQIPPGYYNTAQGLSGNLLKITLHNIIKNHTVVSYNNLWTAFPKTDVKSNGKVWDIYSYDPVNGQPYEYSFGIHECGNYSMESDCYNREHSWPQSWFNSANGPDSDLFHIYPTDGYVNSRRSNYPYGNALLVTYTSLNGSKLGPGADPGYSLTVFEPINEFKGDIARSYFYMTTRYFNEDANWGSSDATNKADILPWQINVLMQWHHQDPVSAKEIARNDSIYTFYQHNRNPFIDHPNFADSIWTYVASVSENKANELPVFSIHPNPSSDLFYLTHNSTDEINYTVQNTTGEIIEYKEHVKGNQLSLDTKDWASGVYILNIRNNKGSSNLKLIRN